MRGTMIEKCGECLNKKVHPIFGGYFCALMKRSFCGLEPDLFLDCKKEALVCYDQEWNRFCVWLNGAESMGVNIHLSTSGIEVIGSIHDGEGYDDD